MMPHRKNSFYAKCTHQQFLNYPITLLSKKMRSCLIEVKLLKKLKDYTYAKNRIAKEH